MILLQSRVLHQYFTRFFSSREGFNQGGSSKVEEEVLVQMAPLVQVHGATVEPAPVARQTLRPGKKLQFNLNVNYCDSRKIFQLNNDLVLCIWQDFDDLPEGSPVRHNPVRNVRPNLGPDDKSSPPARYFTHHLHFHSLIWL